MQVEGLKQENTQLRRNMNVLATEQQNQRRGGTSGSAGNSGQDGGDGGQDAFMGGNNAEVGSGGDGNGGGSGGAGGGGSGAAGGSGSGGVSAAVEGMLATHGQQLQWLHKLRHDDLELQVWLRKRHAP